MEILATWAWSFIKRILVAEVLDKLAVSIMEDLSARTDSKIDDDVVKAIKGKVEGE